MKDRHETYVRLCWSFVTASLVLMGLAWLKHGLDLPFFDDWRGYARGNIESLDWRYLFTPLNDTMTPIGFALDALAQRYLAGNSIAYQFLSMSLVLGGLLYMQWVLLCRYLPQRWMAATCLLLTLLMLQPGSYWGRENMAYHQALPLVALMGALCLLPLGQRKPMTAVLVGGALGLFAGFSYISGAVAALLAGGVLVLSGWLLRRWGSVNPIVPLPVPIGLLFGGVTTVIAQAFAARLSKLGHGVSHGDIPLAWPSEADFWWYLAGKIARSLALQPEHAGGAMAVTAVVLGASAVVAWLALRRVWSDRAADGSTTGTVVVLLVWVFVLGAYLAMVASARVHYRDADIQGSIAVFQFGFERFHFFWVTLVWPWVLAMGWMLLPSRGRISRCVVPAGVFLWMLFAVGVQGVLAHDKRFRMETHYRLDSIACLQRGLMQTGPIRCGEFDLPDFWPAYLHGRDLGASFVRYFPVLGKLRLPEMVQVDLRQDHDVSVRAHGFAGEWAWHRGVWGASDPGWVFSNLPDAVSNGCRYVEVEVVLQVEEPDHMQLFYKPRGADSFTEKNSQVKAVAAPGEQTLWFEIEGRQGFESEIRIDPVMRPQLVQALDVRLYCRLPLR